MLETRRRRTRPRPAPLRLRNEQLLAVAVCWPVVVPSLVLVLSFLLPQPALLPVSPGVLVVYGAFGLALVASLRLVVRRATTPVVGIAFLLVLAFTVVMALDHQHDDYYLGVATSSLLLALPWLFIANAVRDHEQLLRYLHLSAVVVVLAGVCRLYLPDVAGTGQAAAYSQYAGYQVLPAAVILADRFLRRPQIRSGVLLVGAVTLLLAAGARGPLLALLLYLFVRTVVSLRRKAWAVGLLSALGLAFYFWSSSLVPALLEPLIRIFQARGFSTRALNRVLEGDFLEDRARGSLAHYSRELILEHPTLGVGVAGDRLLLAQAMGEHDPAMTAGWYPHNVVLELLLQFGVLAGTVLVVALAVVISRAVLAEAGGPRGRVVLIFAGIGLGPLLVSGSYLTQPLFFALLGFCLTARHRSGRTHHPAESGQP